VAGKCFSTGKGDINFLVVSKLSVVFVESSFCIQGPGLLEGGGEGILSKLLHNLKFGKLG